MKYRTRKRLQRRYYAPVDRCLYYLMNRGYGFVLAQPKPNTNGSVYVVTAMRSDGRYYTCEVRTRGPRP
jgi:hypothetical protein